MGKQKYLNEVESLFKKSPVVDFKSIERIVGKKSKKNNYAKLLIHGLLKKNKIKKLAKGYYSMHNESTLAVFCFKPAYLGLQASLSIHGLWEQEGIPVILTTKKVRIGIRKIMGSNVLIRNIAKKYFFGFEYLKENDFFFPYSDIEKTFIDMVVYKQKISSEVLHEIKKKITYNKIKEYLKHYPNMIKNKVWKLLG